jgi:tRNA(fMet)-specific endonuclease VapC
VEVNLILDTNRYTDFVRGDAFAVQSIKAASRVFLPFVVIGELRAGFAAGSRTRENQATLTRLLQRPSVSALFADDSTTHHYATIYLQLRQKGTPIPTNDLWIAALASQHELILFTRDPHFGHIPQLARI